MMSYMDKKYETLIFDLDGTLATSKSSLEDDMALLLADASQSLVLAVITGGMFEQIKKQVIDRLPSHAKLENIYALPTSGSSMRRFVNDRWEIVYENNFSDDQVRKLKEAFKKALSLVTFVIDDSDLAGVQLENRHSQMTFSALGQLQLYEKKKVWDPSREKREELQKILEPMLPEFDVKIGGSTSIDVTLRGMNKAYGVQELFKRTGLEINKGLFVGDEIQPGGNDYAALETGIDTYSTAGPHDTMKLIEKILLG